MLKSPPGAGFGRAQAAAVARRVTGAGRALREHGRRFGRWTPAPVAAAGARPAGAAGLVVGVEFERMAGTSRLERLVGAGRVDTWRGRLANTPFRAAVLASAVLHGAGLAGLVALQQMDSRLADQPAITI